MFIRDPLSTEEDTGDARAGPSLRAVLGWCGCLLFGLYAWFSLGPEKVPTVLLPGDVKLTPQVLASYRALPPEKQLTHIYVEPYGTEADVVCETLEPLRVRIRYASTGRSEVSTLFPDLRPERLHVMTIENLTPDTDYRYELTSLELDSGLPRVARRGSFRTLHSDDPQPAGQTPAAEDEESDPAPAPPQPPPPSNAVGPTGPSPGPPR